jgi:hypothetical protein
LHDDYEREFSYTAVTGKNSRTCEKSGLDSRQHEKMIGRRFSITSEYANYGFSADEFWTWSGLSALNVRAVQAL